VSWSLLTPTVNSGINIIITTPKRKELTDSESKIKDRIKQDVQINWSHQNSDLLALPSKTKYFLKQVDIDSPNVIYLN